MPTTKRTKCLDLLIPIIVVHSTPSAGVFVVGICLFVRDGVVRHAPGFVEGERGTLLVHLGGRGQGRTRGLLGGAGALDLDARGPVRQGGVGGGGVVVLLHVPAS